MFLKKNTKKEVFSKDIIITIVSFFKILWIKLKK